MSDGKTKLLQRKLDEALESTGELEVHTIESAVEKAINDAKLYGNVTLGFNGITLYINESSWYGDIIRIYHLERELMQRDDND